METILCPYCECKVKMNDIDDEGGVCPECGALITGSLLLDADEDIDRVEEEEQENLNLDDDDDFDDER